MGATYRIAHCGARIPRLHLLSPAALLHLRHRRSTRLALCSTSFSPRARSLPSCSTGPSGRRVSRNDAPRRSMPLQRWARKPERAARDRRRRRNRRVIRTTLGIDQCEIYAYDPIGGILRAAGAGVPEGSEQDFLQPRPDAAEHGIVATRRVDGTARGRRDGGRGPGRRAWFSIPTRTTWRTPLRTHGITRGPASGESRRAAVGFGTAAPRRGAGRTVPRSARIGCIGRERLRCTCAQRGGPPKDALLASASDDLRTPLTTIKGLAQEIGRLAMSVPA